MQIYNISNFSLAHTSTQATHLNDTQATEYETQTTEHETQATEHETQATEHETYPLLLVQLKWADTSM